MPTRSASLVLVLRPALRPALRFAAAEARRAFFAGYPFTAYRPFDDPGGS